MIISEVHKKVSAKHTQLFHVHSVAEMKSFDSFLLLTVVLLLVSVTKASPIVDTTKSNASEVVLANQIEINLQLTFCVKFKLDRESMTEYRGLF